MIEELKVRQDFPIFKDQPNLVYLDSAATSLKPQIVIDKMVDYYQNYSANIFRGIYQLSQKATQEYEEARLKVAKFIKAQSSQEVVFVRNTTEAINLVAYSWGRKNIGRGDTVLTTIMEHHSNFVPWQQLCLEKQATLDLVDINKEGILEILNPQLEATIKKAKLLAITHVSNVLGTVNPLKEIIAQLKKTNPRCLVLVDGAQAVPHLKVDVQDLGVDFYAFSAHKMLGPTGVGVLWARRELLREMPPFNFGGEMIKEVKIKETTFVSPPHSFEAGTPDIAGVIGLGAAIDYLEKIGLEKIRNQEKELTSLAFKGLARDGLKIYGPTKVDQRAGLLAFNVSGIHPHDLAQVLDGEEICIRSGHHCAMPLHQRLGITASARASFYLYNTPQDVERLILGVKKAKKIFKV